MKHHFFSLSASQEASRWWLLVAAGGCWWPLVAAGGLEKRDSPPIWRAIKHELHEMKKII